MAYEMNDLKGILFLILFAIPMVASMNINCHGKAFHCVNSTHFMICVDLGGGVSTTIDDFVIPCPATTVCHEENTFECDFPKIEVEPPLQVLGVNKQSDTSGISLVTASVTDPTTSDTISEFTENVAATTLSIPEVVTPVVILEEHIQQPTQVDNGNTTDTIFQTTSSFVDTTYDDQKINNTIMTLTTEYPGVNTSTDKLIDPIQDQSKLYDSVTSVTGATDLMSVLPENVTMTTSLLDVSTLSYLNASISPTHYQNKTEQITRQDGNAKNMTYIIKIYPGEAKNEKPVQNVTKSNSATESNSYSYLTSTEIANISESVTGAGSVQTTTDMSAPRLVDLILGTSSLHTIVNTTNNSHFDNNVATVDPYLIRPDTNDSDSKRFSEAVMPTETISTDVLISTEQISTTPSINTNLEGFNNTDINYNSITESNFTDQVTTTENIPETNTKYFEYEPTTIPTFVDVTHSFTEVPTAVDQMEIISTTELPIVLNNNSYQINNNKKSSVSENNTGDVINTTESIKTQHDVSNTEPTLLLSNSAKHLAIETPTAEKPPGVLQNEVSAHVIKVTNESSITEGIAINAPEEDIVHNNTISPVHSTTVINSQIEQHSETVTEATVVIGDNPVFITNKSLVTDIPTIVNEPKQDIVENNTTIIINTTKAANVATTNSDTEVIDNPMFSTQFTEVTNDPPVIDNPTIVNEPKQDTIENYTVVINNTTEATNDVRTISVTNPTDNSMFTTQFIKVTNESPVTDNSTIVHGPKNDTVENNAVVIINTTEATNDVRTISVTNPIDNSMLTTQFIEVINDPPVTDNPIIMNDPKQDTVEKKTVVIINTTTDSVIEAIDNSTFTEQITEVTNKSPETDKHHTDNDSKQENVESNTVLTYFASDDVKLTVDPEVTNNYTLFVNLTKIANESRGTILNESKPDIVENVGILPNTYTTTSFDITKENSDTEAVINSNFSAHLTGATNDSQAADYLSIGHGPYQDVAENTELQIIHTTTASGIFKKEPVKDTMETSNFTNPYTTTDSPVIAYSNTVDQPKQETTGNDTVLSVYTSTAPNDMTVTGVTTNSVTGFKDNYSVVSEHLIKETTASPVTAYHNIVGDHNIDANDTLLASYATTPDNMKVAVTEAKGTSEFSNNFIGVTTESTATTYHSNIGGGKHTIVENSKLSIVHTTTAPDIVTKISETEAVDNFAFSAHFKGETIESPVFPSIVHEPKQESGKISAIGPMYTASANYYVDTNSGLEPIVKDSTAVSDFATSTSTGLITEKIDHTKVKIGVTNQDNISMDTTNPPKNLETTTLWQFSSTNGWVGQDPVDDITTSTLNLKNNRTKILPEEAVGINKTNDIASVKMNSGIAPNKAMNHDALIVSFNINPMISTEMPPSNKFVGEPTSSIPDIVDAVSTKDAKKVYEQLLMDGPLNVDIYGLSTTEYIPETSSAFAIDSTYYTNSNKISSFGVIRTEAPTDATQKTYTQSEIVTVTTEKAYSSLGTSVDWNASDTTDRTNTETIFSQDYTNDDVFKTVTEPIRYVTDKIASPVVIKNKDKSIKIVSESDFVNSSNAISSRKLETSNSNPLLSTDYIQTTKSQDTSARLNNVTADYIPVFNFAQVEQPVTKKFEGFQQKPITIVDLLKSMIINPTLPAVDVNTEKIKSVPSTQAPLPRNTIFKGMNSTTQDFNYETEKINTFVPSQEPILSKLNKIAKVHPQLSEINVMASTTILAKTFETSTIRIQDTTNDASVFIMSSTQPVPVQNKLKINEELPISKSKPTETKTTEYYNVKPVLPITEFPFFKTTTNPSQLSKILTQTTSKSVAETNKDLPVIKTTDFPKINIPMENNKSTRSIKGKTTETVNLVTEPDSMVETIKVEVIPKPIVSYTLADNNSNNGMKIGQNKIDHESIVIGNVYKNDDPSRTTDLKPEDNFKVETLNAETDWKKSDVDVEPVKIKETSVEEDSVKSSVVKSQLEPQIKTFLPIPTAALQAKPKSNQTANFIQLPTVTINPTVTTQIEPTISKTEPKPITKEIQKTVINVTIRANNKISDGKLQFQEPLKITTDSYRMNNTKVNVATSYHQLSLQNNTFNDDLAEHLVSTNHTITTEVQNHLNESDKQSNKTSYVGKTNITSTHFQNNTGLKINAGDKENSSISVSTPQDFSCSNRTRGKYSDKKDCRKFYTCIGNLQPMIGTCPNNTVFSEINKQCTRNLSHCVRNNQFRCLLEGRFNDFFKDNIYYICVKNKLHGFIRYKLQCQNGYHLNKATVKCEKDEEISTQSASSVSEANNEESTTVKIKSDKITKTGFKCESEGKFPYDKDCKKYYVCTKIKNDYEWKIKKCASDEVYDKKKKKCVDSDSGEC
uniref:Chitin-binding type-2 domain-containing protein n=1 Tax=Heliothis virescens TaxID=7102 RepID=A0A2A4J650_HELVI